MNPTPSQPESPEPQYIPCGGCGATSPHERCIGCAHDFTIPATRTAPEAVAGERNDFDTGAVARQKQDESRQFMEAMNKGGGEKCPLSHVQSAVDSIPSESLAVGCNAPANVLSVSEGPDAGVTRAPWTPEQIELLNNFQTNSGFHTFTCGAEGCRETLVAKEDGWHCPNCDYRQNWAWNMMTRPFVSPLATPPVEADKDAEIISRITRLHELLSADEDMQGLRCAKILGFIPANPVGKIHGKQVPGVQEQKGSGCVQESTGKKEERHSGSGVEKGQAREIESDLAAFSTEPSRPPLESREERGQSKEPMPRNHTQRGILGSIEEAERLSGLQEVGHQNPSTPQRLLETIRRGLAMCSLPHSEAPKIFRGLIGIEGLCCEIARLREELADAAKNQPINTSLRLFDLVRYARAVLHEDGLITDTEYGLLCAGPMAMSPKGGSPSRQRLEDYDELAADLTTARATIAEQAKRIETLVGALEWAHRFVHVDVSRGPAVEGWEQMIANNRKLLNLDELDEPLAHASEGKEQAMTQQYYIGEKEHSDFHKARRGEQA